MKTAEELFEEIGYRKHTVSYYVFFYQKEIGSLIYEISFTSATTDEEFNTQHNLEVSYSAGVYENCEWFCSLNITPELHRAIVQQMQELGVK